MKKPFLSLMTLAGTVAISLVSYKHFSKPIPNLESLKYELPEEVMKLGDEKQYFNEKQKEKISKLIFQTESINKSTQVALATQGTLTDLRADLERFKSDTSSDLVEVTMTLESFKHKLNLHQTQMTELGEKDLIEADKFLSEIKSSISHLDSETKESKSLNLELLNELLAKLPEPKNTNGYRAAPTIISQNDFPKKTTFNKFNLINEAHAALPFGCQTTYQANTTTESASSATYININDPLVAPTAEIIEVSRRLATAPAMFKYVRDNIRYYPTFGFTQTAKAVYSSRKGNAYDQSILLGSLLRSAGIPSRFVLGEVWVSAQKLQKLWGLDEQWKVTSFYRNVLRERYKIYSPIDMRKIYRYEVGGKYFLIPHAWVEAYTTTGSSTERRWLQFDPSYVLHEDNNKTGLIEKIFDIAAAANTEVFSYEDFFFNPSPIDGKIIKRETTDLLVARKMNALLDYSKKNNFKWDVRFSNYFTPTPIAINQNGESSYGPIGEEACIFEKTASPSSKYFPKVKFGFEGTERIVPMIDMAGKLVNFRYRGATSTDRSKLDLHTKGQYSGRLSDIKLIAQFFIDDKLIKESTTPVAFGPYSEYTMDFLDTNGMSVPETNRRGPNRGGVFAYNNSVIPESQETFDREIQSLNEEISKVDVQSLSYETKSRLVGSLLSTGTMRLKIDGDIHLSNISNLFNGKILEPALQYTFRSGFNPIVFKDRNYGFSPDIPILSIDGIWTTCCTDAPNGKMSDAAFALGSQQEHQIMENHFNVPGRSSVYILQYAKENGIPIIAANYDPNNIDSILDQLVGYGTARIDYYREKMLKGKAGYFYAPKYPVKIQDLTYYVIFSGGHNGGGAGALIGTEKGGSGGPASEDTNGGYKVSEAQSGLFSFANVIGTKFANSIKQATNVIAGLFNGGCGGSTGQPVNLYNGGMWHTFPDIAPMGDGPVLKGSFTRTYLSKKSNDFTVLGYGWTHNLNLYLKTFSGAALDINQNQDIYFVDGDGNEKLITYESNEFLILPYHNISYKKEAGNFILTDRDFNVMTFHGSGVLVGKIKEIKDRNGNTLIFSYDTTSRFLIGVQDKDGRSITLSYQNGMLKTVNDFTGRSVSFAHNAEGELIQSIDVMGNKTTYTYYNGLTPVELNHNLKSFKNEKGEGVEYFYYKNDKVFKHIEPEGKVTTFIYDTYNKQTNVINSNEERTVYRYDVFGNIVSIEQPDRSIRDYKYDIFKNKIYEKDENDFITTYKSDARGNITEIKPPAPFGKTTITYHPKYNVPTLVTDPRNIPTGYEVDSSNGNIISLKQYPSTTKELITRIGYNDQGEISSITDPRQNAITIDRTKNTDKSQEITYTTAEGGTITQKIDPLGRVVSSTDFNGINSIFSYNKMGLLISSATPAADISQSLSYDKAYNLLRIIKTIEGKVLTSAFKYDGLGNIIESTNERGETYLISYKQAGCLCTESSNPKEIVDPKGAVTRFEHDWRGNVTAKIDPMGVKTKLERDLRGNLTNVTVFNKDESIGSQINFVYGALNLLREKSEIVGFATVLNRNTFKTTDPVKGMIVKTIYNHDLSGNLSSKTVTRPATGETATTSYTYNGINLLTGISSTGYKHNVSKTLSYDDSSNLTIINHNKTRLVLQYDKFNRPIVVHTIADITGMVKQPSSTLRYTYTPGGQVLNIKNASGLEIVGHEFDELMRLALVRSGKYSIGLEFDSLGRKKRISYPKHETILAFDELNRLEQINTPDVGFLTYQYDPLSNISQIKSESGQHDFAYDSNSSLIGSYYKGSEGINDEKFVWDASGNRLNGSHNPTSNSIRPRPLVINNGLFENAEPMTDNSIGRYSMIYDMHGNVVKKFDNQENIYYVFEYDSDNKLIYAEKYKDDALVLKAEYTFDGLGRRVEKEVTKGSIVTRKSYVYNGDDILIEYNTSGASPVETAKYIGTGAIDDNLMTIRGGKAFFYHKDHLGSIVSITNDAGEVIQKHQYSSFGKILSIKGKNRVELDSQAALDQPFYYTGREWDSEIDMYYYRNRHYDPQTGRFMSPDPIGLAGEDTNLYRYVSNNPLRFTDPLGLLSFEENLARRRAINDNLVTSSVKTGTSLAIGTAFNSAAKKELGLGVGFFELFRNSFNISTLGTAGTVGNFAATAALKSAAVGVAFTAGQEFGNYIGAAIDTHVDNVQGEGGSSIFESLFFGSGKPNIRNSCGTN